MVTGDKSRENFDKVSVTLGSFDPALVNRIENNKTPNVSFIFGSRLFDFESSGEIVDFSSDVNSINSGPLLTASQLLKVNDFDLGNNQKQNCIHSVKQIKTIVNVSEQSDSEQSKINDFFSDDSKSDSSLSVEYKCSNL